MGTELWMSLNFGTFEGLIWDSQHLCLFSFFTPPITRHLDLLLFLVHFNKASFHKRRQKEQFLQAARISNIHNSMTTTYTAWAEVLNSSYFRLYWNNWAKMNLRNARESRPLFLIIIMANTVLLASLIKYHCCSIYNILANSVQCWVL